MQLLLKRDFKKDNYTIGNLYIDGEWFSNTLEDKDRNLSNDMSLDEIKKIKIQDKTAIPTGTYKITLDVVSPKFSKYEFYRDVCDGKLPRLLNVPGFDGILIHVGSTDANTSGCILVGYNKYKGQLTNGKEVFKGLYTKLKAAQEIYIKIE